ncbi:MAG TPA: phytoene/squalene synthase family protein [Chloroflexota bacterium]|nr:phytoene/squalene synthase family protein [Chloroflexota bacterium]
MTADASLISSYAHCRAIIRRQAHSFYFASFFLPAHKRRDVFALYAFYRTVDDLVDRRPADSSGSTVVAQLARWRAWLHDRRSPSPLDAVCPALGTVIDRYHIPLRYFDALLDGVERDLAPCRLRDFAELERYCYLVAGTVGLVLSYVLGVDDEAALAPARDLGIAMQLTNVLRDIGEDLERGRIYLPADELARWHYSAERLALRRVDADFVALMRMQIARAREYYRAGTAGIPHLSHDSRFPIVLAARMYSGILRQIERGGYDVFTRRACTRMPEKIWIASRSYAGLKLIR